MLEGWFDGIEDERCSLSCEDVCKAYSRLPVLFPLSLTLRSGQGLALLGPNGSGKTTLLRILAGLTQTSGGAMSLNGRRVETDRGFLRGACGFVGHHSYLYDDLTGLENLRFYASLRGEAISDVRLGEALETVGLRTAAGLRAREYSAGMKRRLGLARLLLAAPPIFLLDEPHASLDSEGQELVDAIVRAALTSGRTAAIASHDQERVLALCSDLILLEAGRVVFQGERDAWQHRGPVWMVKDGP